MSKVYVNEQKWNFKVVFNRSCCHGNYKNVKFYLSIKIFRQYIFHLPSFSLWAATVLLPWFGKWQLDTHKLPKLCSATLKRWQQQENSLTGIAKWWLPSLDRGFIYNINHFSNYLRTSINDSLICRWPQERGFSRKSEKRHSLVRWV